MIFQRLDSGAKVPGDFGVFSCFKFLSLPTFLAAFLYGL